MSILAPVFHLRIAGPGKKEAVAVPGLETRIKSLKFTDTEKGADKLVLEFWNKDNRWPDDPIFEHGSTIIASWGYGSRMSPERSFVIEEWTPGVPVFGVGATGTAILMHKLARVRTFQEMKRSDVARILARENGYPEEQQFIEDTEVTFEVIQQRGKTDANLLQRMAKRESALGVPFVFYADFTGFHFHRRNLAQPPRRVIAYVGDGSGDMKSYPKFKKASTKASAGKVTLKGQDPKTKKPIVATATDKTTAGRPGLGGVSMVLDRETGRRTLRESTSGEKVASTPATSEAEAKRAAGAALAKAGGGAGMPVEFSVPIHGDPHLDAKTVVEMKGLGVRLSGNYYIPEVVHSVSTGDYSCDIKARRDGLSTGAGGDVPAATSSAKVNDAAGPDGGAKTAPTLVPTMELDRTTGARSMVYKPSGGGGSKT